VRLPVLSFPFIAGALLSCSSLPLSTPLPNQTRANSAQSSNSMHGAPSSHQIAGAATTLATSNVRRRIPGSPISASRTLDIAHLKALHGVVRAPRGFVAQPRTASQIEPGMRHVADAGGAAEVYRAVLNSTAPKVVRRSKGSRGREAPEAPPADQRTPLPTHPAGRYH
jgi:hypothetical protein